jgi:hypothetical protein
MVRQPMLFIEGFAPGQGTGGRKSALAWQYCRTTRLEGEHEPEHREQSARKAN